jgi:hypothetical protein
MGLLLSRTTLLAFLALVPTLVFAGESSPAPGSPAPAPDVASPAAPARLIHWTEVTVKVRPTMTAADYPPAALDLKLPNTRCVLRLRIDTLGRPTSAEPKVCPTVLAANATAFAMRYRFYPFKQGRVAIPVEFDLAVTFVAPPAGGPAATPPPEPAPGPAQDECSDTVAAPCTDVPAPPAAPAPLPPPGTAPPAPGAPTP